MIGSMTMDMIFAWVTMNGYAMDGHAEVTMNKPKMGNIPACGLETGYGM